MPLGDIQAVNGGIKRWGAMSDNQIVTEQDVLLPGNYLVVLDVDDQEVVTSEEVGGQKSLQKKVLRISCH